MDERDNAKDAYDIAFVLRHFQPDVEALAEHVRAMLYNGLAAEGFHFLQSKFATLESMGPSRAAEVAAEQGSDYEQERRTAFEFAQDLLRVVNEHESGGNETS
jgi:ubiquinone/menaquinone biosynthesis C-methylase UbiE